MFCCCHDSVIKVSAGRSVFCGTFPGSLPLGVTQRPALRSPDFPPSGTHFKPKSIRMLQDADNKHICCHHDFRT